MPHIEVYGLINFSKEIEITKEQEAQLEAGTLKVEDLVEVGYNANPDWKEINYIGINYDDDEEEDDDEGDGLEDEENEEDEVTICQSCDYCDLTIDFGSKCPECGSTDLVKE